ncbi:MAG TPA: ribonuclease P protein component [Stellaceae bacterium]|nr:ribonuclease P protein component [Stellaceae bacterium]
MAPLARLKKRAEFLHVAGKGRRWTTPGLVLQALPRPAGEGAGSRVGFTASRRVGMAVLRNRARRRLKEAVRRIVPDHWAPGDYVVIARTETARRDFADLVTDLETALRRVGAWRADGPA